jgi:hypothetical protein
MFETAKELAALLDGREYRQELTEEESQQAKQLGLVVVFGRSDDTARLTGAINDDTDCYDGGDITIYKDGLLEYCADECSHYREALEKSKIILVHWQNDYPNWMYETNMHHEKFTIIRDGQEYCDGIVFSIFDVSVDDSGPTTIQISDNLRIARTTDNLQWQIQERHITGEKSKAAGKETWKGKGYYTKLEHAGTKCIDLIIGQAGQQSAAEMFAVIEQAKQDVIKAVGGHEQQ